ncbi:hypothetical protein EYF80_063877 [Liparis tanakae]|uniref:Uncharacterized protein n=1 Tax=Liparis tanakae TaxID=230148 RepID=A0A4Z2EAX1_9TELE|nr:hypothetical protein EYF80_063877 [Liparis tanakae]
MILASCSPTGGSGLLVADELPVHWTDGCRGNNEMTQHVQDDATGAELNAALCGRVKSSAVTGEESRVSPDCSRWPGLGGSEYRFT